MRQDCWIEIPPADFKLFEVPEHIKDDQKVLKIDILIFEMHCYS